jgi:hypothetical protein
VIRFPFVVFVLGAGELGGKEQTDGMKDLLSVLRLERERIQQDIRNLEHEMRCLGMRTQRDSKDISIRRDILASDEVREVADLAFDVWLSNGFRGDSPEEALMTAVRQSRTETSARLFLTPKRKSSPQPFPAMRFHSN